MNNETYITGVNSQTYIDERITQIGTAQTNALILKEKSSPDSLSNILNSSTQALGAYIYIIKDSNITAITNNFYLSSVTMGFKERVQLLESFNGANITFFGSSVKVYNFQGTALDWSSTDKSDPGKYFHQSSLIKMYDSELRGSQLVKAGKVAVLKVLNHTIEGYPINLQVSYSTASEKMAQFSLTWVVTKHDLSLDSTVNDNRLRAFYDYDTLNSLKVNVDMGILKLIEEFYYPKNRTLLTDSTRADTALEKLESGYGTLRTEDILLNPLFFEMRNNTIHSDYFALLRLYLKEIMNNESPLVTEAIKKDIDNYLNTVDSVQAHNEFIDKTKELLRVLEELRKNIILRKINILYGTN